MSAYTKQIGGTHYTKKQIQPMQLAYRVFGGDTSACKIAKYLTREKDGWAGQIDKARHVLDIYQVELDFSPVPYVLTKEQLGILNEFIDQEPEQVRDALFTILMHLVRLKNVKKGIPEGIENAFNTIRSHYKVPVMNTCYGG